MSRVIAIANLKGGVAKTTTTVNLSAALADRGRQVLAVDLDPQASLTFALGIDPSKLQMTVRHALDDTGVPIASLVYHTKERFQLVPAGHDLNRTAHELEKSLRISAVRAALEPLRDRFDYVLLDCPANAGIITGAALAAADEIVIPFTTDYLSFQSLNWFIFLLREIREVVNPSLRVGGIFYSMHDPRTHHARETVQMLREAYGAEIPFFSASVRPSVSFKEAASAGVSIFRYAPGSPGAEAYRALACEVEDGIRVTPENELYFILAQGKEALAKSDMKAAFAAFCRATDINPALVGAWTGRAESAVAWDEKIRCYARALRLAPNEQPIRVALEKSLAEAVSEDGHVGISDLINSAHCLEETGKPAYAARLFRHVTELDPRHEEAWLGMARTTVSPKDALVYIERCLAVNPDNPLAKNAVEQAHARLKTEAARLIDKGLAQLQSGNRSAAHSFFVRAVDFDPPNDRAWLEAAKTADNFHTELSLVKRALQVNPRSEEAQALLRALVPPEHVRPMPRFSWPRWLGRLRAPSAAN